MHDCSAARFQRRPGNQQLPRTLSGGLETWRRLFHPQARRTLAIHEPICRPSHDVRQLQQDICHYARSMSSRPDRTMDAASCLSTGRPDGTDEQTAQNIGCFKSKQDDGISNELQRLWHHHLGRRIISRGPPGPTQEALYQLVRLLLLEAALLTMANRILSSSLFLSLIFAVLPIGVLIIRAFDNLNIDTTARLGLLQAIAGVIIGAGTALANVFLSHKAILTTKMAREGAEARSEGKVTEKNMRSPQPVTVSQIHVAIESSHFKDDIDGLDSL